MIQLQQFFSEAGPNPQLLLGSVVILLLTYPLTPIIYNLFFHPLRHFPGPLLHRASALPWALQHALGTSAFHTEKFHTRYGPVVRIAPNHLSFTDPAAWRDIYGPLPRPGMAGSSVWPEMPKSKVFTSATDDQPESIIQAGFHDHARMRKALAPGFGEPALRRQEPVIKGYLDMLVAKLHQQCESDEGRSVPVNMEKWFNWTTFDIGGELVFGRMFRCLEKEEYHPWIAFIMGTLKAAAAMVSIIYLGGRWLVRILFNTVGQKSILTLREMTEEMVGQRLAMEKGRDDLFEGLVKFREEGNFSFEKYCSNALVLTLAGSETLATTLCGATYLLLDNPETRDRLAQEVRTAFGSADEITVNAVSKLPYLTAVINESMRMYPPVVADLIRVVPPEGKQIAGHYVTADAFVEIQPWSINHSPANWVDPWKFNPDRFLPGEEAARREGNIQEALQAFSFGPRDCLGRRLAWAEMRLILARIVFEFDMKLAEDGHNWIERQKTFPLWDRQPLNVYFTPVERD